MDYFGKVNNTAEAMKESSAKEKLEFVLIQLSYDKYSDKDYNAEEYLNNRFNEEGIVVEDDNTVIVEGWKFNIDRETLQIEDSLGKQTESKDIAITSEVVYNDITSKATITYTITSKEDLKIIKTDGKSVEVPERIDDKYTVTTEVTTNGKHNIYVLDTKDTYKIGFANVEGIITLDELVNNLEKYRSSVLDDADVMKKYASNEEAINRLIESDEWRDAILGNENAIKGLDNSNPITVPTMTSNTTPSGEAFASSYYYDPGFAAPAWYAFDVSDTTYWGVGAGLSYVNEYIAYDFERPIWVYKTVVIINPDGQQKSDFVIEASNDKKNWVIIKDGLNQSTAREQTIISNSNKEKYQYYRLRFLNGAVNQSNNGFSNTVILRLQFYGK